MTKRAIALAVGVVAFGFTACVQAPSNFPQVSTAGLSRASISGARAGKRPTCPCTYLHPAFNNNSIVVFGTPSNRRANIRPAQVISGSKTGLSAPAGTALDASGNLYVLNGNSTITTYAPGANGNVAPVTTISGGNTLMRDVSGIALDSSANIYVSNDIVQFGTVLVYAAGSNGDVAPIRMISGSATGLNTPTGVAVDGEGSVYVMNFQSPHGSNEGYITVYPPGANGNVSPVRTIAGPNTGMIGDYGIAVDAAGNVFAANQGYNRVLGFPAGANGNVSPSQYIAGRHTHLNNPVAVAVDSADRLYVTNVGVVTVFAPGATGNIPPLRMIRGSKTGLGFAGAISVH